MKVGIYDEKDVRLFMIFLFKVLSCFVSFCRTAPLKENRKSKKFFFEKRGPQCLLSLSVCVYACLILW